MRSTQTFIVAMELGMIALGSLVLLLLDADTKKSWPNACGDKRKQWSQLGWAGDYSGPRF